MTDSIERFDKALEELNAKRAEQGHPPVDDILRIHLIEFYSHGVYTGIEMYYERLQQHRADLENDRLQTANEIALKA